MVHIICESCLFDENSNLCGGSSEWNMLVVGLHEDDQSGITGFGGRGGSHISLVFQSLCQMGVLLVLSRCGVWFGPNRLGQRFHLSNPDERQWEVVFFFDPEAPEVFRALKRF